MKTYCCPVCKKPLTQKEYERALGILGAREKHFEHEKAALEKKLREARIMEKEARKEGERKGIQKSSRIMVGLKKKNDKLRDRIRQLEKGSLPQTEGLEFADQLAARLKREFPDDDIRHNGKGEDVLHIVRFNKKPAGIIIYECKTRSRIESQHVYQAHLAKQSRETDFAVLVTTGQKKEFSGLARMNGILVVSPLGTIPLASLLRKHLIEMLRAEITKEERAVVAQQLVKYITSPQFKNPIEEVVRLTSELQDMIKDEAKEHFRSWKERRNYYQTIQWDCTQIQNNLKLVLHGKEPEPIARPEIPPLQLPAPTE